MYCNHSSSVIHVLPNETKLFVNYSNMASMSKFFYNQYLNLKTILIDRYMHYSKTKTGIIILKYLTKNKLFIFMYNYPV